MIEEKTCKKIVILMENDRKIRAENNETVHKGLVAASQWRKKHYGRADLDKELSLIEDENIRDDVKKFIEGAEEYHSINNKKVDATLTTASQSRFKRRQQSG